jgi:hypothetical protein
VQSRFLRTSAAPSGNQNYLSLSPDGVTAPSSEYNNNLAATMEQAGKDFSTGALGGNAGEYAIKKTVQHLKPNLLKSLLHPGSMGVGILGEFAVGALLDHLESLKGAQKLFADHAADVQKIIIEVNRLTNNDPQVVAAGNQVWSYVLEGKERLDQMILKTQEASAQQTATASTRFRRS